MGIYCLLYIHSSSDTHHNDFLFVLIAESDWSDVKDSRV